MHVVILGAGIAGLTAARTLSASRVQVTLVDQEADAGGRCRSFFWNGMWLDRGAETFIPNETIITDTAREIGLLDTVDVIHSGERPPRFFLLKRRSKIIPYDNFDIPAALKTKAVPAIQKLALAAALPTALRLGATDDHDPVSAAGIDNAAAAAFFRKLSPRFVDYFLEPSVAYFTGLGGDDYSLAWLLWVAKGRFSWGADYWWKFAERGCGQLTYALEQDLAGDSRVDLRLSTRVDRLTRNDDRVSVDVELPTGPGVIEADAAIVAVPGASVLPIMPDLDDARRSFFEQITYSGHHNAWYILDKRSLIPNIPEPGVVLPAADGFTTLSRVTITQTPDGRPLLYVQWKDHGCRQLRGEPDGRLLDAGFAEAAEAFPDLAKAVVVDRVIQRNDAAVAKRPAGYLRHLKRFRDLGPLDRVVFAGDYLTNSTVGQSAWSGERAATELLAQPAVPTARG